MNKIIDTISKEIGNFETKYIYITDKVSFNQFQTLKKIVTHQNNGFTKSSNKKRFFFNIGNSRIDTIVKKIDFDTKDINLHVDDFLGLRSLFLESEMRQYLKDTAHAKKINSIVHDFADIGNVVVKKNGRSYDKVNLINLKVIDQTAENLEDTTVIEEHVYNVTQFKRVAKEKGWSNIDATIEDFIDMDDPGRQEIRIYERYGEVSVKDFKEAKGEKASAGDDEEYINAVIICAVEKSNQKDFYMTESQQGKGHILFAEELVPQKNGEQIFYKPYREAHFGAYQGRWFREGPREKLFDIQDRSNILGNQLYEAMKWSSLHLFWSQDPNIAGRNIFKSLEQGQILQTQHISVLPVEERNLSAHVNEWNRLMELADKELQSFEVATGQRLPSGTTLGQVEIQTATVGEHFHFLRQELAIMFKDIFNHWVLPDIIENINKEHTLKVVGSPQYMDKVYELSAEAWVKKNIIKAAALAGTYLTEDHIRFLKEMKKQEFSQKPEYMVNIIKGYYRDIKPVVDVIITGESVNLEADIRNGMMLTQYVSNPQVIQDPVAREILIDVADKLGFDIRRVAAQESQRPQPDVQQSVAQPATPPEPARGGRPGGVTDSRTI